MPHGDSWFSLFPFHDRLLHVAQIFGKPFNEEGVTWYAQQHPGIQHVYGGIFILFLIAAIAVITETSIRNAGNDLLPHDRLTLRTFVELLTGTAYSMMSDIMGKKAARHFLPLIGTCAFFILFSNMIGLVPGFLPPTDNLNTTFACGLVIFVTTHIYGLKENGWNHVKHLFGPIIWLAPLIFLIELISHLVRPITLAVRLMANMTADHMVLVVFLGFSSALYFLPIALPMYALGLIVVTVQTMVFCLLSTVYIAMAIEHTEH